MTSRAEILWRWALDWLYALRISFFPPKGKDDAAEKPPDEEPARR